MEEVVTGPESRPPLNWVNRLSPQAVFVLVAGLFGVALAFITPPTQVPDEPYHWFRIYQLSEGKLLSDRYGGDIPVSIDDVSNAFAGQAYHPVAKTSPEEIRNALQRPLQPEVTRWFTFPNTAIYPIIPYAPQTLTMFIARKLKWPALGLLYAGRLGTVIGYVLLGWAAIRITPVLKWPLGMILTCPMALFLAGSLSEDPITTALVSLAIAVVLRCILSPGISARTSVALALLMIAVALCKSAYFPVAFLVLAIPRDKWGAGSRRWIIPIGTIALSLAALVSWSWLIKAGQVKLRGDGPALQMPWILHHPKEYADVLRTTLAKYGAFLIESSIGELGWVDTPLKPAFIDFWFIALVWVTLAYDEPLKLRTLPRVIAALVALASAGLVVTACYLYANWVGFPEVEALQGRYFLPIGMLACIVIRRRGPYAVQSKWMLALLSGIGIYTVWVVIERYYLPPGILGRVLSGGVW